MEIGNLATQKQSNEGKWFLAVLYGKKQPFAINILGSDSDSVKLYEREQFKKLQKERKGNDDVSDEVLDELLDSSDDAIVVRMNGLCSAKIGKGDDFELLEEEPLTMNGQKLGNDEKSYRALIEAIPEVKKFVREKSNERINFLSNGKKN